MIAVPIRVCALFAVITCLGGCGAREEDEQSVVEAHGLAHLQKELEFYANRYPGVRITNMLQLFLNTTNSPWGYPHALEAKLRTFGRNAGFTNSIYEKYVIMPPRITNRLLRGELVLINAQPFPDQKGELTRMGIYKRGQDYLSSFYTESLIQQILTEAGVEIPKPTPLPKPPPPPSANDAYVFGEKNSASRPPLGERLKNSLDQFGRDIGIGGGHWMTIGFSVGFVIVLGIVVGLFLFRRGRTR